MIKELSLGLLLFEFVVDITTCLVVGHAVPLLVALSVKMGINSSINYTIFLSSLL